MLSVADARARIMAVIRPLASERVAIDDAWGRVLAEPITAGRDLPPADNSAMDGFAVRAADLSPPCALPVVGAIAAGDRPGAVLEPGTALRIMTGAPLPSGADAVVIREDVDDRGESAVFAEPAAPGDNIRRAGEDIAAGALALATGARLGAGEIGLAAALGRAEIAVGRRPRVAILSTGDELVDVGTCPGPGQIVNSNAYALAAQVREAGGVPVPAGIAPDDPVALIERLRAALDADLVVTSGGASMGDHDHIVGALAAAGVDVAFWKVAMKPGKPLAFGVSARGVPVFGLPGNPVSSMVVFELFARPALLAMQGARACDRPRVPARLARGYRKQPGRAHYVRASITAGPATGAAAGADADATTGRADGDVLWAVPLVKQGSGMLSSMVGVDALVELPAERGDVAAGERVSAILVSAWPSADR